MKRCTRRLEFDAAHRVMRHESKCRNLHGHRYIVALTVEAPELDDVGRVIDFSVLKGVVGRWIDDHWDHGTILCDQDLSLLGLLTDEDWKRYTLPVNPTAENMVEELHRVASDLLDPYGIRVAHVRLYETPNCWSDYSPSQETSP